MKHGFPRERSLVDRAGSFSGLKVPEAAFDRLALLAEWLVAEAIPAGGLGPEEGTRIWERHIAECILFARVVSGIAEPTIMDVGTGVGLPAIPLAIAVPNATVIAVDRSERRIDLLRRAVRILDLKNIEPWCSDVDEIDTKVDGVVSRGFRPPTEMIGLVARLLTPGGEGLIGLSTRSAHPDLPKDLPKDLPDGRSLMLSVLTAPDALFESHVSFLRMVHRVDE